MSFVLSFPCFLTSPASERLSSEYSIFSYRAAHGAPSASRWARVMLATSARVTAAPPGLDAVLRRAGRALADALHDALLHSPGGTAAAHHVVMGQTVGIPASASRAAPSGGAFRGSASSCRQARSSGMAAADQVGLLCGPAGVEGSRTAFRARSGRGGTGGRAAPAEDVPAGAGRLRIRLCFRRRAAQSPPPLPSSALMVPEATACRAGAVAEGGGTHAPPLLQTSASPPCDCSPRPLRSAKRTWSG